VIRINSQSGKSGAAYVMEVDHGLRLPRRLAIEFSAVVQARADASEEEIPSKALHELFEREYLSAGSWALASQRVQAAERDDVEVEAVLARGGERVVLHGVGGGPIDAFVAAVRAALRVELHVVDYAEHALGEGEDALAVAYVEMRAPDSSTHWGVGRDRSIVAASFEAVVGALNRFERAAR